MIVRNLNDVKGTPREINTPNWVSRRILLAGDGMGFSLHETIIRADTETPMCYRNHLEAVYCVQGSGEIEDLGSGKVHAIEVGTLYALDQHDEHILRAHSEMRLVCVFNPPLQGPEVHDESGAYPILAGTLETKGA